MTFPAEKPSSSSPTEVAATATITPAERRRATISVATGTALEYFDWIVYSVFSVYFAPLVFRADDLTSALLQSAAVFATGYLMRPIGAVLIGKVSDRHGRKPALTLSVTLITIGTLMLAAVPTYAAVGVWSSVMLVVARVLQGLAFGGEFGTASATLREISPPERRGRVSSSFIVASSGGNILGFVLLVALSTVLSPAQMTSFGWRIPFALAVAGAFVLLYLRLRMIESPVFRLVEKSPAAERGRIRDLLTPQNRVSLLLAFGAYAMTIPIFITVTIYSQTLGVAGLGLSSNSVGWALLIALVIMAVATYFFGWLGDRYGTVTVFAMGLGSTTILIVPTYLFITGAGTVIALTIGVSVLSLCLSMWGAVQQNVYAALLPPHLRALGVGLAAGLATAAFGGPTQFVALSFAKAGFPAGHFILMAVLGLCGTVVALVIRKRLAAERSTPLVETASAARKAG
jgi:MFS transporter, MHS family, alpha-ketoglutarate permease